MKKNEKEIDNVLGQPIFDDLPDKAYKIKRNLIIFCTFAIFSIHFDFQIKESSFLGFKIENLDMKSIYIMTLVIIIYNFIHYVSYIYNSDLWNRIRVTGKVVKSQHEGAMWDSILDEEYSNKPNTTLYSWWKSNKNYFIELNLKENLSILLKNHSLGSEQFKQIENLTNYINESKLLERLERFDKSFWYYQKYQKFQYLLFELVVPFFFTIVSVYMIAKEISSS